MSTTVVVPFRLTAHQINGEHRAAEAAYQNGMRAALTHALRAGRLLNDTKGRMDHGEWLPWVEANVDFSRRRAQEYMQLAESAPELEDDARTTAHLTIEDALRQIRKPREPRPEKLSASQIGNAFADQAPEPAKPEHSATRVIDLEARNRLRQGWTEQQMRKRERATDMLQEALNLAGRLDELSRVGVAGLTGEIGSLCKRASTVWTELAMDFEQ